MDNDMLLRADLAELWDKRNPRHAVQVVKHDYTPKPGRKFLGREQSRYARKNWSSVMLFNNAKCSWRGLDPVYVNNASGLDLHQFKWCPDEDIGTLPGEWNHLVGEYPENPNAKLVHWTLGGPWFEEYVNSEFADEWFEEMRNINYAEETSP